MNNPYEVTTALPTMPSRLGRYVIAALAGAIGYGIPIGIFEVIAYWRHGAPAAFDNFDRVLRIHSELSLNTFAAFTPNLVLAILVSKAMTSWMDSDASQSRWWILAGITVMGIVVVSFSLARWNLIPWNWPNELNNSVRSALTLMFPVVAARLWKQRIKDGAERPNGCIYNV